MTEPRETLFWWLAGAMKFGPGALGEIGADAAALGLARVLVVSDRQVVEAGGAGPPPPAPPAAESSAVCVMDLTALHLKSGISHTALRPRLSVIDPLTTLGLPREATISSGLDVLSHTLESLTASRFDARPRSAGDRPTYCGSNPV